MIKLPRKITTNQRSITIAVVYNSNGYNSTKSYVTINGTKKTASTTMSFTVPPDAFPEISIYVDANNTSYAGSCVVTLDGVNVQEGAGSYALNGYKSYRITMSRNGSTSTKYYWTAAIVST